MFHRRTPKTLSQKIRDGLYPRMGLKRAMRLQWLRLLRSPDSNQSLAGGFAVGAAISATPLLTLHLVVTLGLCWLTRLSLWAGALGTVVGNPWTFPFIWALEFAIGGLFMPTTSPSVSLADFSWRALMEDPYGILLPLTVGSIPVTLIMGAVFYWGLLTLLNKHKKPSKYRASAS